VHVILTRSLINLVNRASRGHLWALAEARARIARSSSGALLRALATLDDPHVVRVSERPLMEVSTIPSPKLLITLWENDLRPSSPQGVP